MTTSELCSNEFILSIYILIALVASLIGLQRTPLHWAAERGHAEIIPLLNDASAQLEAKDKEGVSTCMSSDCEMSNIIYNNIFCV